MFPLSCREDDLGKGEKKRIQLSQCAPKQRCACSKAGVPSVKIQPCPTCCHYSCSALLKREQRHGLEVTWGSSAFPLCLTAAQPQTSQQSLGKQVKTRQKLSFKAAKVIVLPVFSAILRHPNLAALQHELAADRTSHLHSHRITMLQCCSLSRGRSDLGATSTFRYVL